MSVSVGLPARGAFGGGRLTQTAGTVITRVLGGKRGMYTYVTFVRYTVSTTNHLLTLMRSASFAKVTTAVAASGTDVIVDTALTDGAGGAIAANDYVVVELDNGEFHQSLVSTWTAGTKTIVLTTAIPSTRTIVVGAQCYCYGVPADSYHAQHQVDPGTSATVNFPSIANAGPVARGRLKGEPIIFYSGNATAAGTLEAASGILSPAG